MPGPKRVVNGAIAPIRFDRLNVAALRGSAIAGASGSADGTSRAGNEPEPAAAMLRVERDGKSVEILLSAERARDLANDLLRQVAAHEGDQK